MPSITESLRSVQQISSEQFGIIISDKRLLRLKRNQLVLWCREHNMTLDDLIQQLSISDVSSPLYKEFISIVTIGESYFFRHRSQLEAIVDWIKTHVHHPVRIWSAACSMGCEVYSLAYLLREADIQYYILGTDIDHERLTIAQNRGPFKRYAVRSMDASPSSMMSLIDKEYWINESFQQNIEFAFHNLKSSSYPKPPTQFNGQEKWDIIICRNAFIYFTQEQTKTIMLKMSTILDDHGSLWMGVNDAVFDTNNIMFPHRWQNHGYLSKALGMPILSTRQNILNITSPDATQVHRHISPSIPNQTNLALLRRCLKQGLYNIAKDMLEPLISEQPDNPYLWMTLGAIHANNRDFTLASSIYTRVSLEHQCAELFYLQGLLHYAQQQYPQAKQMFERTRTLNVTNWSTHLYLGIIHIKQCQWIQAVHSFEESLKQLEQNPNPIQFSSYFQPKGFHDSTEKALLFIREQIQILEPRSSKGTF